VTTHRPILDFLAAHNTLTLATVGEDARPHAAALFYAHTPDLRLIFLSEPDTLHARHIGLGAPVAVTIQADGQAWQHITGVQMHGLARPAAADAREVYLARYPFVARTDVLARALKTVRFYEIIPTWIRLIDNRLGFGHKQEWRFDHD